ncbi:uncharacterized protein LOC123541205 [Mercenaria mercenaria]|uniref:uncharacterized protein LOC123541205 n=1 Tax=Mercenaria mercenaria TaxID=6596 RepID=UPI00234F18B4|nr:uncharacterized protein LOC123541205 [Mercenaria mercenaria]
MLDNLVKLQYTGDPNPGEHRSKQICTLPITLQGLPLDSEITREWHQPDCEGVIDCLCKKSITLRKEDVERVLLQPTEREETALSQFQKLMTWGCTRLWKHLTDDALEHVGTEQSDVFEQNFDVLLAEETEESSDTCTSTDDLHDDFDLAEAIQSLTENIDDDLEYYKDVLEENAEEFSISCLEKSMEQMSFLDETETENDSEIAVQKLLGDFGFFKFIVPKLLCRHPPPEIGRDDDIAKIREVLDDIYTKLGYGVDKEKRANRILCGPDQKIGQCLLKLIQLNSKYEVFLPEFPLLHLRKSKITILLSSYKDAGILQLIKYMKDDNQDDLTKLISIQHIDVATRYIKRLALALHLAFLIAFTQYLAIEQVEEFIVDVETNDSKQVAEKWSTQFEDFLSYGSNQNATFALHRDMMNHCDEVVAVALSERLGGPGGYALLLAAVKSSLPFSFVNNASSYAPYCVQLLYHHHQAGFFHQCMKQTLYTTPFKSSKKNFACDTKREMDHLDVLKGFRSGSNVSSITCRMSLIDSLSTEKDEKETSVKDADTMGFELTDVDIAHIVPTATLILRRNALRTSDDCVPMNVYAKTATVLPSTILDKCSQDVGKYLLYRFVYQQHLFGLTESDVPKTDTVKGNADLISRAKRSKGITIKRTLKSKITQLKSSQDVKEEQRQRLVAKKTQQIDCLSSENNCCQSLVKPDCSKPKVMKALSIRNALNDLVQSCIQKTSVQEIKKTTDQYIMLNQSNIPQNTLSSMQLCTIEYAGQKFKLGNLKTGKEYLLKVESTLKGLIRKSDSCSTIVICEEKYMFTPDDFKAGTHQQRRTDKKTDVSHLKSGQHLISDIVLNKEAITKTEIGKKAISTFLAENITKVNIDKPITLVVDSELYINKEAMYSTPIQCHFTETEKQISLMSNIQQRKGEAEMAVTDWLQYYSESIEEGKSVVCLVTSGDIDAVYLHMYTVCKFVPRFENGQFKYQVYVVLQKPSSKYDIYNITSMLELFESAYSDSEIGLKIPIMICIGGNDFIPKFYQISHKTILSKMLNNQHYRQFLIRIIDFKPMLDQECYTEFVKDLFCPRKYAAKDLSYDEVRCVTINKQDDQKTADPRKWLPPKSAIENLCELTQLCIAYMDTAGNHESQMPNFLETSCLKKNENGDVLYDFGPEAHFDNISELPNMAKKHKKRQHECTPQKGLRRKRPLTSTPKSIKYQEN